MGNAECYGAVCWCDDDIRTALRVEGKEESDENVEKVKEALRGGRALEDHMIEAGWELIYAAIANEI